MVLFMLCLAQAQASGLSIDTGKIAGLSFLGLVFTLLVFMGVLVIMRPRHKGIISSLMHMTIFIQSVRYISVLNWNRSIFYSQFFYSFSVIQDPFKTFDRDNYSPWIIVRIFSTNFIKNSLIDLIAIAVVLLIWLGIRVMIVRFRGPRLNRFLVFIVYCSAVELSLSAFIQLKSISFNTIIDASGSALAIFYLSGFSLLIIMQLVYIYKTYYDSWLILVIIEDFVFEKKSYSYLYLPFMITTKVVYCYFLVFMRDVDYLVPIVIGVGNLLLCKGYLAFYLLIIRPFVFKIDLVFVIIELTLEVIFAFLPMVYSRDEVSYTVLDILIVALFGFGLLLLAFKALVNARNGSFIENSLDARNDTAKVTPGIKIVKNEPEVTSHIGDMDNPGYNGFAHTFKENENELTFDNNWNKGKLAVVKKNDMDYPIAVRDTNDEFLFSSGNDILQSGGNQNRGKYANNPFLLENAKPESGVFKKHQNVKKNSLIPESYDDAYRNQDESSPTFKSSNYAKTQVSSFNVTNISDSPHQPSPKNNNRLNIVPRLSIANVQTKPKVNLNKFTVKNRLDFD